MRPVFLTVTCLALAGCLAFLGNAEAEPNAGFGKATIRELVLEIAPTEEAEAIDESGVRLKAELAKHDHRTVLDELLPLLRHEKKGVRLLASFLLLGCRDALRAEDLPALKAAYESGAAWLPAAIASLKSQEAVEFLVAEFRKKPETGTQIAFALRDLGKLSVPHLVSVFEGGDPEDFRLFESTITLLGDLGDGARSAAPHLLEIAEDPGFEIARRKWAILALGQIASIDEKVLPRLRALAIASPDALAETVAYAIIISKTPAAAEAIAKMVDEGKRYELIEEFAQLGELAIAAGPRAMRWLDAPDWDARVMAARALGTIGYAEARPHLEELLKSQRDWRLAYAATLSLADLDDERSIPALESAATGHWMPVVREKARAALASISANIPFQRSRRVLGDQVDWQRFAVRPGERSVLGERKQSNVRKQAFAAFEKQNPEAAAKFLRVRDRAGGAMVSPISSLRVASGLLLGAQAGEWVGGLQFHPDSGEAVEILPWDVTAIEIWRGTILVAANGPSWNMNRGMCFEVSLTSDGASIQPWFVLPGDALDLWQSKQGALVIECVGGVLVFSDDDEFRFLFEPAREQER